MAAFSYSRTVGDYLRLTAYYKGGPRRKKCHSGSSDKKTGPELKSFAGPRSPLKN